MNKIAISCVVSCLLLQSQIYCKEDREINKRITLESPLVDFMDRIMPGSAYGLMLQVRREVRKRLYGAKDKSGNMVGMYEYGGGKCTVTDLAAIEDELEKSGGSKKELLDVLEIAKEDFLSITECYIDSARGTKEQLLGIIQESCDKRGLKECFILRWAEEEEGEEGRLIREELFTFKEFRKFCIDLSNFMEDLARSCPKTKRKFLELVRKSKGKS